MLFDEFDPKEYVVNYTDNGKFHFIEGPDVQIPKFKCTWGVTKAQYEGSPPRYYMDLDIHQGERSDKFVDWLVRLEEHIKGFVKENEKMIFGKEGVDVNEMYKSLVNEDKFRIKVDKETVAKQKGRHEIVNVLEEGKMKNCSVVCMLRVKMLYFMNGSFGLSLTAPQVEFEENVSPKKKILFLNQY